MTQLETKARAEVDRIDITVEYCVGQWCWLIPKTKTDPDAEPTRKLVVVNHNGTNYVGVSNGSQSYRVLDVDLQEALIPVSDREAEVYIDQKVTHYRTRAKELTREVSLLLQSNDIGVAKADAGDTQSLAVRGQGIDLATYKSDLLALKEDKLPALREEFQEAVELVTRWMGYHTLPIRAQAVDMSAAAADTKDKLFNLELYAGLAESATHVREGEAAPAEAKVHLMQRKLRMDEECLLNYRPGGMQFSNIDRFDAWLAEDENLERLMPFPRCVVVFDTVRSLRLPQFVSTPALKESAMYLRNGDNLYRLMVDLPFGEHIFPNSSRLQTDEVLYADSYGRNVVTQREHEAQQAAADLYEAEWQKTQDEYKVRKERDYTQEELKAARDAGADWVRVETSGWRLENVKYEVMPARPAAPYAQKNRRQIVDFTHSHYDEVMDAIAKDRKYYNRIATLMQGLLDRSDVFAPHPPAKLWTQEGFTQLIELVFDGDQTLHATEDPPDFEAYRDACNASVSTDSVLVGQEAVYLRKCADEAARSTRERYDYDAQLPRYLLPFGDEGPGFLARPARIVKSTGVATFQWVRDSKRSYGRQVTQKFRVSPESYFNVSAYTPGDYKQFYNDLRTREKYMEWAPYLLAAEDFHGGKLEVRDPEGT